MNLLSLLTGIAVIGASVLTLEGVSQITNGEFYLAGISQLAQESAQSAAATVESQPSTTKQQSPPTPPTSPQPVSGETNQTGNHGVNQTGNQGEENQQDSQEFIDPRQIQEGLRNMNQFRGEVRRTIREIRKQASPADLDELNNVLAEVDKLYATASNSSNLSDANDAVREFHDNQYWEKIIPHCRFRGGRA